MEVGVVKLLHHMLDDIDDYHSLRGVNNQIFKLLM